jgi:hypothetical protein
MKTSPTPRRLAAATVLAGLAVLAPGLRADYPAAVGQSNPRAYFRFEDSPARTNVNFNEGGTLGAAGHATNVNARAFAGALAGTRSRAQFFDGTASAIIPWQAALNPPANEPFTLEAWLHPASDQIQAGQAAINNRFSYPGVNRQGWVIFQRAPDDTYAGRPGFEGVGWNFRMYNGAGGSAGLQVTSGQPFEIGQWLHLAVVYDPADAAEAERPSLTMFMNGAQANKSVWTGDGPAYVPNTDDHDPAVAVRGPAGLSLGAYNNTEPGSNPYFGAVDELAFHRARLTPAQILAHYQSGTNAARATPHDQLILAKNPVVYLPLEELPVAPAVAVNLGDLRAAGHGENTAEVRHQAAGPLAGQVDAAYGYRWRNGSATTVIPWNEGNNPDATTPFTMSVWLRPTSDRINPGASPVANRYVASGNRTGWVIFQRAPNETYAGLSGFEGVGWNFRMYTGTGGGGQDVTSRLPYTVGEWTHLVVTWDGAGTLTMYVNGEQADQNPGVTYAANTNPPESGDPSDLAFGSYNRASGIGNNAFEGDVDEFAFYRGHLLTPEQVRGHYQTATNSATAARYPTLVLTAASDGQGTQRLMPATYLRFNEPGPLPVADARFTGRAAGAPDGVLLAAVNDAPGPRPPAYPGFPADNAAVALDGVKGWAALNEIAALDITGNLTLAAWIQPGATQGEVARIISRGPPTLSSYLAGPPPEENGSVLAGAEVFLRLEGGGATYAVGASDGTNTFGVTFPVPAGDLGGDGWIHLAGTYDGSHWRLYRNGVEVAAAASATGALPVPNAGWAVGAAGNGWADHFTGAVDEAAVYPRALPAAELAAHHAAALAAGGELTLAIARTAGRPTITWDAGVLQQAAAVTGPYTDVAGATTPYTPPVGPVEAYFRLRR